MIDLPSAKDTLLQRHTGVSRVYLRGDPRIAEAYLGRAKVYMGWLRNALALGGVNAGARHINLENGVKIRVLFDGVMNIINIYAPPVTGEAVGEIVTHPLFSYLPHDDDNYGFIATESGYTTRSTVFVPAGVDLDSVEESFTHLYVGREGAEAKHRLSLFTGNQTFGDDDVGWFSYWGTPHGDLPLQTDTDNADNGYYMPYVQVAELLYTVWMDALDGLSYPVPTGQLYHNKTLIWTFSTLMIVGGAIVRDLAGGKHALIVLNNGALYEVIKTTGITAETTLNEVMTSRGFLRERHQFHNMYGGGNNPFISTTFMVGGVSYTVPAEKHTVAGFWGGWEWRFSEEECAIIQYPVNGPDDPPDRIWAYRYELDKTETTVSAGSLVGAEVYYLSMTGDADTLSIADIGQGIYTGFFSTGTWQDGAWGSGYDKAVADTQERIDAVLATEGSGSDSVNTGYTRTGSYPIALNYVEGELRLALVTHAESGTFIGATAIERTVDVGAIIVAEPTYGLSWKADVEHYHVVDSGSQQYAVTDNRSVTLAFADTVLTLVGGVEEDSNDSGGLSESRPASHRWVCLDPSPLHDEAICSDPSTYESNAHKTTRITRDLLQTWPQYLDLKTGTYAVFEKDFTYTLTDAQTTTVPGSPKWRQTLTTTETTRNRLVVRPGYAASPQTIYDKNETFIQVINDSSESGTLSWTNRTEFSVNMDPFIFAGGNFPPYWHSIVGSLHCAEVTSEDQFLSLLSWYVTLPAETPAFRNAVAIDVGRVKTNIPGFTQASPYGGGHRLTLIGV